MELVNQIVEAVLKNSVEEKIVVYGGRFQPFHKGHKKVYDALVSKFGSKNVYIASSDVQDSNKSPLSFKEKKEIATKLFGIPSSKFVKVKNPYQPVEVLRDYDEKKTALIVAVGEKDNSRLGGAYFKPYKGDNRMKPYGVEAYVYTSLPSNSFGATDIRNMFRNKRLGDKKKHSEFERFFGKWDQSIYNNLDNKLNEGFPNGVGIGLTLPNGYINGAPSAKKNKKKKYEDVIPGGKSEGKSIYDIAQKYKTDLDTIKQEIKRGAKVELEHTNDIQKAAEIAKDHIWEDLWYYDKLSKIEPQNEASAAGSGYDEKTLDMLVTNPETGDKIKVRSALNYDRNTPVYKAAMQLVKQNRPKRPEHDKHKHIKQLKTRLKFKPQGVKPHLQTPQAQQPDNRQNKTNQTQNIKTQSSTQPQSAQQKGAQMKPHKENSRISVFKGEKSGKEIKTIGFEKGGNLFGVEHRNEKMVDDIINQVKNTIPQEKWKDIVFVGEGGRTDNTGELKFNDEVVYASNEFKKMGASIDTFDGDELDVHKPESALYKMQMRATGLSLSQIKAGNWASMIGQGEGTDTMPVQTFLDDEGKKFLEDAVTEAGFVKIENWDNPTDLDKEVLYRLSFPEDNGDKETKVNDIQIAFNKARDLNLLLKTKKHQSDGKIPITIAGDGHVDLVASGLKVPGTSIDKEPKLQDVPADFRKEVATKINDLQKQFEDDKKNGVKREVYNLCKISVPGTNLYCDGNKNIKREAMPQFKGKPLPNTPAAKMQLNKDGEVDTEPMFRKMLDEKGIKVTQEEVPVESLKATQNELVGQKVLGMEGALEENPEHPAITAPIYVSKDGYVVDGHHRWAAVTSYNLKHPDKPIPMKVMIIDDTIDNVIPMANKFAEDIGIAAKSGNDPKKTENVDEDINVNVDKGDEVLMGKFKNKKVTIKNIGKDQHGMPTINGKQATTFRKVNESLLLEGGAYGHMNHPFDIQMNLTFGDLKNIVNGALEGDLGIVREKTDGQALAISWKNGRLIAARNKSHLANAGAGAMDAAQLGAKFGGRGALSDAYSFAVKDLENAIRGLSDKQKEKIFKNGKAFVNLEVIYPENANVIPYGQNLLVFHNVVEYNEAGNAIGKIDGGESILAGMIKQINAHIQSKYKIQGPPITTLPKTKKLSSQKGKFIGMINKLQKEFNLKDNDGVADYHQGWWDNFITKSKKKIDGVERAGLIKRWAFDDKSFRIANIKNDEARDWAEGIDKGAKSNIMAGNLRKFEDIFLAVGAEVLSFMSSVLTANPNSALQSMRKSLESTAQQIMSGGTITQIKKLEKELARLNAIGGFDKIVPNEGLVFVYKGNTYKLTGAFAPLNQILGIFKFSR